MKLVLFNDFVPGVLKGARVVDVSSVVDDIPHINAQTLMSGLIERFDQYRDALESAVAGSDGVPASEVRFPGAAPGAGENRLHGRQLYGERYAEAGRRP